MTRRILYVIDSLSIGGAEMLLMDLVDAARARGWSPTVAFFTPGPLLDALAERGVEAVRVGRAGRRGMRDPLAVPRLVALMRRLRPEVVHTHLVKSDLFGQLAARLARVPHRVLTMHNANPWRKARGLRTLYGAMTAGVHRRIAVSREVADHAGGDGIVVVDNGVDMRRFDPAAAAPLDLAPFGVPEGAPTVAVIGRLRPQKDHDTFLDAVAALAGDLPPGTEAARFLIVGTGERREALEARARTLGLEGRVAFTGVLRDMPALLAALDVVAFSSAWEGLPVTLLEAMAMERCVVSTAVGGIPGVATDGADALLVPAGDPRALAEALRRVLADPGLRDRLGRAARATVAARFGGDGMVERTFALYEPASASASASASTPAPATPDIEARTSR